MMDTNSTQRRDERSLKDLKSSAKLLEEILQIVGDDDAPSSSKAIAAAVGGLAIAVKDLKRIEQHLGEHELMIKRMRSAVDALLIAGTKVEDVYTLWVTKEVADMRAHHEAKGHDENPDPD